jgi:ParB-like chromosome segregation protein Spo0J
LKMIYTQHPLSAAFPAMQADEFQSLVDSIGSIGVQNPITLLDGMVIDGWHRYKAATSLGMDCPTVELDDTDPRDFVLAQNKSRRNLTASQRANAVTAVYQWAPAHREKKGAVAAPLLKTNAELAVIAGTGVRSIQQAKTVHSSGVKEVQEAVKTGTVSVEVAAAVAKLPAKEQQKVAAKGPEAMRQAAKPTNPEPEHDDGMLTEAELIAEMQETQAENVQLQERVTLMASDDKAAEIDKLLTRINGLEGRINQLMMQVKTSADGEKYHATVIHKLRKLLGVEGHKEIIAAVTALVADRRLAA